MHGSYQALADDSEIDVVYVATPHSRHQDDSELFMRAGKHVLCEKPFALNHAQALAMVRTSRETNRFIMEALWSRFLPVYTALGEVISASTLGAIARLDADFGIVAPQDPRHRLNDPTLGGGALLDLGIYCLHIARFVLGDHDTVSASAILNEQGVDVDSTYTLGYASGATARLRSTSRERTPCTATIVGEHGSVVLDRYMHHPPGFAVRLHGHAERYHRFDDHGVGLRHQVFEVHRCIEAGLIESPRLPHHETLRFAETMDEIRRQIGVQYAADSAPT